MIKYNPNRLLLHQKCVRDNRLSKYLTDMDRMTMEKVEELYLYIFELKKEIEILKKK